MIKKQGTIPALQRLSEDQGETLIRWLLHENLTYAVARARLKAEFGVSTSVGSLSNFFHDVCLTRQWAADRALRATGAGRVLVEIQIRANPDQSLSFAIVGSPATAHVEIETTPAAKGAAGPVSKIQICRVFQKAP